MHTFRRVGSPSADRPAIVYGRLATRLGPAWVAVSARGVCRLALGAGAVKPFVADIERLFPTARVERDDDHVDIVVAGRRLDEWMRGRRREPGLTVDLRGVTPFQRRVLEAARRVPSGRTVSYGDLARRIGCPGAARAVGGALSRNPVPLLVPCHRVVGKGGRLGGYTVGRNPAATQVKRALLAIEQGGTGRP